MATSSTEPAEVEFSVKNTARIISLNRPSKLNALNESMCNEITPRLIEFSKSKANNLIILKSNSPKAFCSGGDVIQCAKYNLNNEFQKSINFFQSEYSLNYLLSVYNKPIVSLVNGIAMGGGVGLAVHGPFRVVCETTRFAMPETNIGFFSDVGTSFWLPKLDGNLGYYLSLTGDELTGFDALIAGFGTHYVPTSRFDELIERLSSLNLEDLSVSRREKLFSDSEEFYSIVNQAVEEFTEDIPSHHQFKYTAENLKTIETCFDPKKSKTVEDIIVALSKDGSDFALATVKNLESKSKVSLALCWKLLTTNSTQTIRDSLSTELSTSAKMMIGYKPNDFTEYILKNLINKKSENPEDKLLVPAFETLESVPASLIDELTSSDVYKPEASSLKISTEEAITILSETALTRPPADMKLSRNYTTYPYAMGLPTQSEIEAYIKGDDDSNRQYSVTFKETIKYFKGKYEGKNGVYWKVKEVLKRKTKSSEYGDEYLEWVD